MENKQYLTVSALNNYIKYRFDNDTKIKNLYLKAEISNVRKSKGFLYFVLKDENSEIDAIMFPNNLYKMKFNPVDGMKVIAFGSVEAYAPRGKYSFLCNTLEEVGMGQAYLDFLKLKETLDKEGLFDPKFKKPIPQYAQNIGVVTSATGDAINDIIFTFNNRFPLAKIYLYPALVQGPDAPKSLVKSLLKVDKDGLCDLIIIGRGGGSLEDLSCFNDEGLARAIFACNTPVISAVGHEADFTICDFVSDLRAPTPTGAAMLASVSKEDIFATLYNQNKHLNSTISNIIEVKMNAYERLENSYGLAKFADFIDSKELLIDNLSNKLGILSPINVLNQGFKSLDDLHHRLSLINLVAKIDSLNNNIDNLTSTVNKILSNDLEKLDKCIASDIDKLILLNPLNVLAKGYSVAYHDGKMVKSVNDIKANDELIIKVSDGEITSIVK